MAVVSVMTSSSPLCTGGQVLWDGWISWQDDLGKDCPGRTRG